MTRPIPARLRRLLRAPLDGDGNHVSRAAKAITEAEHRGLIRVRWVSRTQGGPQYYHYTVKGEPKS